MIHPREAFEQRILESGDCWLWTGRMHSAGYGRFGEVFAHRQAWEWWNDRPVPAGLVVRHTCDVRRCVNPHHLVIGTRADNSRDMVIRGRSTRKATCLRGHPMSGDNLIEKVLTKKVRICRVCRYERTKNAAAYLRQKAAR